MPRNLTQKVEFDATPGAVWDALVEADRHAAFTGAGATSDPRPGGALSAWDEYITGFHLDLVPGRRLVQAWRASDWAEGWFSVARFDLEERAGGGTVLTFTHLGVPDEQADAIAQGWHDFYWTPLREWIAAGAAV